jgi:hypothetical protein
MTPARAAICSKTVTGCRRSFSHGPSAPRLQNRSPPLSRGGGVLSRRVAHGARPARRPGQGSIVDGRFIAVTPGYGDPHPTRLALDGPRDRSTGVSMDRWSASPAGSRTGRRAAVRRCWRTRPTTREDSAQLSKAWRLRGRFSEVIEGREVDRREGLPADDERSEPGGELPEGGSLLFPADTSA